MRTDHAPARPRRHDDVVELFELAQCLLSEITRDAALTRVVGRLPAAGLGRRHHDFETRTLNQLDDRKTDLRTHQVNETGDEQTDSHKRSFGKTSPIIRCLACNSNANGPGKRTLPQSEFRLERRSLFSQYEIQL